MATTPMTSCSLANHTAVHQHVSDCATRCPSRRAQLVEDEARRVADIVSAQFVLKRAPVQRRGYSGGDLSLEGAEHNHCVWLLIWSDMIIYAI